MTIEFNYKIYTNSPITHWMMGIFNNHATGRELTLSKDVKLSEKELKLMNTKSYNYKSRSYVSKLIIEEVNKKLPSACLMTLMYVLVVGNQQNWRNNKAVFSIDDYLLFKGEEVTKAAKDAARRQFKQTMERLLNCKIEVNDLKRSRTYAMINLLGSYRYDNGLCTVEFPSAVVEALNIYPQLFPTWGGQLTNQKAFAMTIYIYFRIKLATEHTGELNINVKDLLSYAGIPYSQEQITNWRHKQLIITPFLKAIDEIHLVANDTLKIEVLNYSTIEEFLNSHVIVKYDDAVANYYNEKKKAGKLNGSGTKKRVSKRKTD